MKYYYTKCHKTVVAKKVFHFKPCCSWKLTLQVSITAHDCRLIRFMSKPLTSCTTQGTGPPPRQLGAGQAMMWAQNRYPTRQTHQTGHSHLNLECKNNSVLTGPSTHTRLRLSSFFQSETRNLNHISKHICLSSWSERCVSSGSAVQPSMGDSHTQCCIETNLSLTLWDICTTLHPQLKQLNAMNHKFIDFKARRDLLDYLVWFLGLA